MPMSLSLIILASVWLAYFALHSLLASLYVKQWLACAFPRFTPAYRLTYNILAILLLVPPLWLMRTLDSPVLWSWEGGWQWLANALALCAIAGFLWSLRYYSGTEFLGLEQLRQPQSKPDSHGAFTLSPLHCFVRHPWYFFALVIIWTRDMDPGFFITAVMLTLYFIVGSRLEENKLIHHYGEVYRRYRTLVPGLVPLPWRYLDRQARQELLRQAES